MTDLVRWEGMEGNDATAQIKEAYQEGFRDGFEYGSGKRSPYGCDARETTIASASFMAERSAND